MRRPLLRPAAMLSVLIGLVALTGCHGTPAEQAPTEAAASAEATPTSTPTPTPTIDPADPTHWIVSFDGIGPLQLGKSYSTSNPALGEFADQNESFCDPLVHSLKETEGVFADRLFFTVRLNQGSDMINNHIKMNLHNQVAGQVEGPKTDKGIGIGSSEADTRAAYPSGVSMFIRPYEAEYPYLSVPSGTGHYILFHFGDVGAPVKFGDVGGPVTAIDVQTFPESVWEYC